MRILRVITRLNVGGPSIQAIDLSRELSLRGHTVALAYGQTSYHEGFMKPNHMEIRNLFYLPSLGREIDRKWDFKALKDIHEVMEIVKPDIVHTHQAKAGVLARLAALFVSPMPKLVHTYHGHTFHSYFSRPKEIVFNLVERFLARFTDVIIAISEGQKKELVSYGLPEKKIRVVPNGFNLEPFLSLEPMYSSKKWRGANNRAAVGIVGRIAPVKNHELFHKFCDILDEQYIAIEKHIIDDKECIYEDMPNVYKKLDIVVNSSKNEGTPTALIEAMASGCLVVATPVGGNKDLLGWDDDNIIAERGFYLRDPRDTAYIMNETFTESKWKDKIERARDYVKTTHSLERLVSDIDRLYKDTVFGSGNSKD